MAGAGAGAGAGGGGGRREIEYEIKNFLSKDCKTLNEEHESVFASRRRSPLLKKYGVWTQEPTRKTTQYIPWCEKTQPRLRENVARFERESKEIPDITEYKLFAVIGPITKSRGFFTGRTTVDTKEDYVFALSSNAKLLWNEMNRKFYYGVADYMDVNPDKYKWVLLGNDEIRVGPMNPFTPIPGVDIVIPWTDPIAFEVMSRGIVTPTSAPPLYVLTEEIDRKFNAIISTDLDHLYSLGKRTAAAWVEVPPHLMKIEIFKLKPIIDFFASNQSRRGEFFAIPEDEEKEEKAEKEMLIQCDSFRHYTPGYFSSYSFEDCLGGAEKELIFTTEEFRRPGPRLTGKRIKWIESKGVRPPTAEELELRRSGLLPLREMMLGRRGFEEKMGMGMRMPVPVSPSVLKRIDDLKKAIESSGPLGLSGPLGGLEEEEEKGEEKFEPRSFSSQLEQRCRSLRPIENLLSELYQSQGVDQLATEFGVRRPVPLCDLLARYQPTAAAERSELGLLPL